MVRRPPAAQTAFGPMFVTAVEQYTPPAHRIVDAAFASRMLPAAQRLVVRAGRWSRLRRLGEAGSDRKAFGVWGGVQSAFNAARIPVYAEKIAAAFAKAPRGPRASIRIATSDADPFKEGNLALSAALTKKGVANDRVVHPGLHDQVFLREAGTLEMLFWHDRRMR